MKEKNPYKTLFVLTLVVLLVLVVISAYLFVVKPTINGYVIEKKNEGYRIAITDIVLSVQQQGFVQIPLSDDQSLVLVPYTSQQTGIPSDVTTNSEVAN